MTRPRSCATLQSSSVEERVGSLSDGLDSIEESLKGEIDNAALALNRGATSTLPFVEGSSETRLIPRLDLRLNPGTLENKGRVEGVKVYVLDGFALTDGAGQRIFPQAGGTVRIGDEYDFQHAGCKHSFSVNFLKKRWIGSDRLLLTISRSQCMGAAGTAAPETTAPSEPQP